MRMVVKGSLQEVGLVLVFEGQIDLEEAGGRKRMFQGAGAVRTGLLGQQGSLLGIMVDVP